MPPWGGSLRHSTSSFFVGGVLSCMCVYLDIHSCAKYAAFWRLSAMFRRYICLPVSHRGLVGVYVCFLTSTLARRSNALTISMPLSDASRRHSASRSPWEVSFRVCGSIFTYTVTNCHLAATLGDISQVHVFTGFLWRSLTCICVSHVYMCVLRYLLWRDGRPLWPISMPLFDASWRHSASSSLLEASFCVCGSLWTSALSIDMPPSGGSRRRSAGTILYKSLMQVSFVYGFYFWHSILFATLMLFFDASCRHSASRFLLKVSFCVCESLIEHFFHVHGLLSTNTLEARMLSSGGRWHSTCRWFLPFFLSCRWMYMS